MTLSFWHQSSRMAPVSCDVAVVGGGFLGCSTAYWLRKMHPALRVTIVEAARLAAGASGRNAGFLLQGHTADYRSAIDVQGPERARRLWDFTRENRDLICSELRGEAFRLERSGSMTAAGSEEEDVRLQASAEHLRADGVEATYLPPDALNRRLRAHGFLGGLYVPSGAMLDPAALVRHVAQESGAQVLEHHPVLGITETHGRVMLESPVRHIRAGQVVLALNAYLPRLYPSLGRYLRPVRAQMLSTEPAASRWLDLPVYTHAGYFYVRQTPEGRVLLGGARHLHLQEEVGYSDEVTPALQADLEHYLHTYFPRTRGLRVLQRWSGVMAFSPDALPFIGNVPELPGCYWTAGFTGHGMAYGFRVGRLLAELISGHSHPEGYDLFSAERFTAEASEGATAATSTGSAGSPRRSSGPTRGGADAS